MTSDSDGSAHRRAVIGDPNGSFWLYSSQTGFDLSHPSSPTAPALSPLVTLTTTTHPITIHPPKSALVIVDMQNFFLSPFLGRDTASKGLQAQSQLLQYALPAARKAGIRVIWLNWGLTDIDIQKMPPATLRAFGFETVPAEDFDSFAQTTTSKDAATDSRGVNDGTDGLHKNSQSNSSKQTEVETGGKSRIYRGLGSEVGSVTLQDGSKVQGGRLLMRDTWNAALTPELHATYQEGLKATPPDLWIHKNRMSGLWGGRTPMTEFLETEGITTLLFAGVNTDQCVAGSLQDAFTRGWDCVLLSDGCGTTSGRSAQECIEFNCGKTWGFCLTCKDLAEGVDKMRR